MGRHAVYDLFGVLFQEVARQILRLELTAPFLPEPKQGRIVVAHDDPGVGAADE
jgi:hypothetical protein